MDSELPPEILRAYEAARDEFLEWLGTLEKATKEEPEPL